MPENQASDTDTVVVSEVQEPKYQCSCLEVIKQKLTEHHGEGSDVQLELKMTIDTETLSPGLAIPPLYYSYVSGKKRKKSYVTFSFCPFCGKRYQS